MSFVKKTPAEFEALSEYQKEKYLDEKAQYETKVAKENAEAAAKAVIEEMRKEHQDALNAQFASFKEANDAALAKMAADHGLEIAELQKTLNRAKIGEVNDRMKGMPEMIIEKLSTEEGEAMVKGFLKGKRESLNLDVDAEGLKAMVTPTGGVAPQFAPIVGPGYDDIHARDVIPVFPTIADIINYVQFTVDPEAEGFQTVAPGEQKPDIGYISSVEQAYVRKIAGLLDVADEMMDDVVGFRSWLAYELPKAYMDAEDMQIFKGDGTGTNLLGLWTQADLQSFPMGSVTTASNTIDKIAAGITEVRKLKRPVSAVFISPVQWMEILINKGTTEEYTYPVIFRADGVMTIGGVPIYWSNVFEDEEGIVGDFARGTAIFQRKAMNIAYSGEHKDNFGKNVITIRLEGRLALPIYWPEAFLKLFTATS